jgi:tetratricopeptide (TPR) repeat protein
MILGSCCASNYIELIKSMARNLTEYRVFIASPSGLDDERKAFKDTLDRCNLRDAHDRGVHFTSIGWELTLSGHKRAQELINDEIRKCDYFVLVLHNRWGTPPGDSEERFTSGTEEELDVAKIAKKEKMQPMKDLAIFFKAVNEQMMADPGPELHKVLEFRKGLEKSKEFLYRGFDSTDIFAETLDRHLAQWIRDHENKLSENGVENIQPAQSFSFQAEGKNIGGEVTLSVENIYREQLRKAELLASEGKTVEAELAFSNLVVKFDDAWPLARFGRFLRKTGNRHRATDVLTRAIERARQQSDLAVEAYITRQLGRVQERSGNTHAALSQYLQASDMYQKIKSDEGTARTFRDLALAYRKLGEYEKAIELLDQSQHIFTKLEDYEGVAAALGYKGIIYKAQGKISEALAAHSQAHEIHERLGDISGLAVTKSNLGIINRLLGKLDDAKRHHSEALETYIKLHDLQGQSRELSNLGTLARTKGDFNSARELHTKSLGIAETLQNKHGIAIQYSNLGRDLFELNRLNEAEKLHLDSLQISRAADDPEGQAWQYEALGNIEKKRDHLDSAHERYEKAESLFTQLGSKIGEAKCILELGDIAFRRNQIVEAERLVVNAQTLYETLRIEEGMQHAEALLAKIRKAKLHIAPILPTHFKQRIGNLPE